MYRVRRPELSLASAPALLECLRQDGQRTVAAIVSAAETGPAASLETALFALAVASSPGHASETTTAAALAALPVVAPSAADLSIYAAYVQQLRGWGRGLRTAISRWYAQKGPRELAREVIRSRQRAGWSNRDLLRMAHPKAATHTHDALFQWILTGEMSPEAVAGAESSELQHVHLFERARRASSAEEIVHLIEDEHLPEDLVPVRWKQSPEVWEALLYAMPYVSLLRNLAKMTETGMLEHESEMSALVVARLVDKARIRASEINPLALLTGRAYYQRGAAVTGRARWIPVRSVLDALDEAFHCAIENVEPSRNKLAIGIDPSVSMLGAVVGSHGLDCATAAAAVALIAVRRETYPEVYVGSRPLYVGKGDRLADVRAAMRFGEETVDWGPIAEGADVALVLTAVAEIPVLPGKHVVLRGAASDPSEYVPAPGRLEILGFDPTVLPVMAAF